MKLKGEMTVDVPDEVAEALLRKQRERGNGVFIQHVDVQKNWSWRVEAEYEWVEPRDD